MLKKFIFVCLAIFVSLQGRAQGWPAQYDGVMLQGFYWDSYTDSRWTNLASQVKDLAPYFNLVWIPQSGNTSPTGESNTSMGYDDLWWFNNYNSTFGSEAELRNLISIFKTNGIGTIADVVINHRKDMGHWVDFPKETYKGETYQLLPSDIVSNDEAAAEAAKQGFTLSKNADSGEGWSGMRDLDHNSENVQRTVIAYLRMLLDDLGYTGFRYDMTKGYAGRFTALYNSTVQPQYSVGEYWDGNVTSLRNWVDATKQNDVIQSAAFDFPIRYTVRDALNNGTFDFSRGGLATMPGYDRYAVTFVENHDTEYRSSSAQQDPLRRDTLAANAYILGMPGTPCVFMKHWMDYKKDIKMMIAARKTAGIHNQSSVTLMRQAAGKYYAFQTTGKYGKLLTVVGSGFTPGTQWAPAAVGYHYSMYLERSAETPWVNLPSGRYDGSQSVQLTAISADDNAKVVYTLNGAEPTADNAVTSGTTVSLPFGEVTLKVGLLVGGVVKNVKTFQYNIVNFQPYTITIYANADVKNWTPVYFWTWGGDGSHSPKRTSWPGDAGETTTIDGATWYKKSFTINTSTDVVNLVLANSTGAEQTIDITNINTDKYYKVSLSKEGSKYTVEDLTSTLNITHPTATTTKTKDNDWYTLTGAKLQGKPQLPGVYIYQGKKVVIQ